jgi:hypothetical protein
MNKLAVSEVGKIATHQLVDPAIQSAVDTYGALLTELQVKEKKLDGLRAQVQEAEGVLLQYADEAVAPSQAVTLVGSSFTTDISARRRDVVDTNKQLLKDLLDDDVFLAIAKFNVTDLRRYLTGEQVDDVLTYDYVGKRRVRIAPV